MNFKKHFQQTLDLPVAETEFLVQERHQGVNVRPQLDSNGPDGVGGLQFMSTLHMRAAAEASSRVDIELPVDDHARDVSLELDERVNLGQFIVSAVWAARRQGNVVGLIDLLGHRWAMVLAVILAANELRPNTID